MRMRHRPTARVELDIIPEDSFLLDRDEDEGDDYAPRDVALEAWSVIRRWADEGYLPIIEVTMPDGSTHLVDLEQKEAEAERVAPTETSVAVTPEILREIADDLEREGSDFVRTLEADDGSHVNFTTRQEDS